ncbi:hypothetical protein MINS_32380 [Mycolicibacterium insubricum]|uniref:Uncharacterized protein n=1 Tax=Mycolicibacterium insubricum TaxID=444597 RepID=A0A1X0DP36_9MYCO|nr:hypothetical protein [Mycolicibacterium insubricum]MCV7081708.1 hypothetical protein [Mycolicibacterium insubricum]ORA74148.1 hypothetical protein BST26_00805 [Mycolicibacterium insubricum]BBZ67809.1 hypothetical protein MINS_32380 [Mycolicibacterium insubricum]
MTISRIVAASALAAGLGAAGLGLAMGTAAADPGRCDHPGCQIGGRPIEQRGIDDARRDHQPFWHNGHRVDPMRSGDGRGWGYWDGGIWNWL